jgi:type II secretory ATPase GspE/PulE/Tfp pilus assembly ATPase PilB-like protein
MEINEIAKQRLNIMMKHFAMSSKAPNVDELDELLHRAEEIQPKIEKRKTDDKEVLKYTPYLIVPTYVEDSARAGNENRERRRQRVKILYDVHTFRAQTPAFLDVSQDDPKTPLSFRYIRIILLTAAARKAQDIHLDQYSRTAMSVVFTTQLGLTSRIVIKGAIVQSIIYYIAFYDLLTAGKPLPGPVRDYSLKIKVKAHAFLEGTHNVYRVNCIRTNHELGYYHIVMRVLQN